MKEITRQLRALDVEAKSLQARELELLEEMNDVEDEYGPYDDRLDSLSNEYIDTGRRLRAVESRVKRLRERLGEISKRCIWNADGIYIGTIEIEDGLYYAIAPAKRRRACADESSAEAYLALISRGL